MKMHYDKFRNQGFTLVEFLVVFTLLSVLAGLLLPAVHAARESARNFRCVNNLKQIGIAIQNYHAVENMLPRGEKSFSIHTTILPYLEQRALFDSINFFKSYALPVSKIANRTASYTMVENFVCPSDPVPRGLEGGSNYGGNRGVGFGEAGALDNGPFSYAGNSKGIGLHHVTDGSSQTAAFSEFCRSISNSLEDYNIKRAVYQTPETILGKDNFDRFATVCKNLDTNVAKLNGISKGRTWMGLELGSTLYNHVLAPNNKSCTNQTLTREGAWTAGSYHNHGANVLYVDGHVQFANEKLNNKIWQSLGTINGGEIISELGY